MILTSVSIWTWGVQSHANVDNVIQGIKICDYHLLLKIVIQVASW